MAHDNNFLEILDSSIIDREGKKYKCSLKLNNKHDLYALNFIDLNKNDKGVIEFTDIFSWAAFLDSTKKTIKIDKNK